jgi:hypothetical protein
MFPAGLWQAVRSLCSTLLPAGPSWVETHGHQSQCRPSLGQAHRSAVSYVSLGKGALWTQWDSGKKVQVPLICKAIANYFQSLTDL